MRAKTTWTLIVLLLALALPAIARQNTDESAQQSNEPAAATQDSAQSDAVEPTSGSATAEGEEELPETASPLAALLLLGLGAAGAATGVRFVRRRG